ncbi:Arylesterase [uncultured Pleomorphomonas sp.]|uniref:Arylesterase n=2 Tax=uncultured Pleomorphomonas sp. TaxID=442121 RepID=A0A212LL45_9HYPH|nr:Arylesterase [uncultured Pleomorphomonas sp.]
MRHRIFAFVLALLAGIVGAEAKTMRIVALGDSLTAGYGVLSQEAFPDRLEAALVKRGHDVDIVNAGVSGDTVADGLARLDWALADGADGVIVELGANDMLRGHDPALVRDSLDELLSRLDDTGLPVLVAGMRAAPNLGADYAARFDPIFPELAEKHGALLYPFFLDGVASDASLNQADRMHPNAAGVEIIVERILPSVEALIERINDKS